MIHLALIIPATFVHCVSHEPLDFRHIEFVIMSQYDPYNNDVARELRESITNQILDINTALPEVMSVAQVIITQEVIRTPVEWAVVPLCRELAVRYQKKPINMQNRDPLIRWIVFLEPHTFINVEMMLNILITAEKQENVTWIGHGIKNKSGPYQNLLYPDLASGFVMRFDLLMEIAKTRVSELRPVKKLVHVTNAGFYLAQRISQLSNFKENKRLESHPAFCDDVSNDFLENCVTQPKPYYDSGNQMVEGSILFVVRLWNDTNSTADIIRNSWGKKVSHIIFFNEHKESFLPAHAGDVFLSTGYGMCAYTLEVLRSAVVEVQRRPTVRWIFFADSHTVVGVKRLCDILSYYHSSMNSWNFLIGERHGFDVNANVDPSLYHVQPYDYIALGGGLVLPVNAAALIATECQCETADSIDERELGKCAYQLGIKMIHSPFFHRLPLEYYQPQTLKQWKPVTFNVPPEQMTDVYHRWFEDIKVVSIFVNKTETRNIPEELSVPIFLES